MDDSAEGGLFDSGPIHMIPGQLTDPRGQRCLGARSAPVTVHMSFSLPRDNVTLAPGQSWVVHCPGFFNRPSVLVTFFSDSSHVLRFQM